MPLTPAPWEARRRFPAGSIAVALVVETLAEVAAMPLVDVAAPPPLPATGYMLPAVTDSPSTVPVWAGTTHTQP